MRLLICKVPRSPSQCPRISRTPRCKRQCDIEQAGIFCGGKPFTFRAWFAFDKVRENAFGRAFGILSRNRPERGQMGAEAVCHDRIAMVGLIIHASAEQDGLTRFCNFALRRIQSPRRLSEAQRVAWATERYKRVDGPATAPPETPRSPSTRSITSR
jgi:hypothetical protein